MAWSCPSRHKALPMCAEVVGDGIIRVFAALTAVRTPPSLMRVERRAARQVRRHRGRRQAARVARANPPKCHRRWPGRVLRCRATVVQRRRSHLRAVEFEGKPYFSVRQRFESPDDEAFYGTGLHQQGWMNLKGRDVELLQHNIDNAIPFLVSSRNYGILWDNNSITRYGDPRGLRQIGESFTLYDKDGVEGALSATYSIGGDVKVARREEKIDYQYISGLENFPDAGKNLAPGGRSDVLWEGEIAAKSDGRYTFSLYNSEYAKLYIDGELVIDRWRQNWNPWHHEFALDLKAGERHRLRLEWDRIEPAYIALFARDPLPADEAKDLSIWSEAGQVIDYYVVAGDNGDEVIAGYRRLTGKAVLLPKWAYGFWQSRERYKSQRELTDVVDEHRRRGLPLDNIVLDWSYWPQDAGVRTISTRSISPTRKAWSSTCTTACADHGLGVAEVLSDHGSLQGTRRQGPYLQAQRRGRRARLDRRGLPQLVLRPLLEGSAGHLLAPGQRQAQQQGLRCLVAGRKRARPAQQPRHRRAQGTHHADRAGVVGGVLQLVSAAAFGRRVPRLARGRSGQARVHPQSRGVGGPAAHGRGVLERRHRAALGGLPRTDLGPGQCVDGRRAERELRHRRVLARAATNHDRAPARMARTEPALVPAAPSCRFRSHGQYPFRDLEHRAAARRTTPASSTTSSCYTCCPTSMRWLATRTTATAPSCALAMDFP